ncbi:MAG: ATP-binding cassette domain-containing protein [Betaproteobacteria bacterium]|nr:ATP-binding cassette domain-containing protein [Betaproteobacteria bacterium]
MLRVEGLAKSFGGLRAVDALGFEVARGEILGLIGPNGSGKSTTMALVMGVQRPDEGSIRLDGEEIAGLSTHHVARRGVGIVFQHSRPLRRQTVLENVELALMPDRISSLLLRRSLAEQARAIAERVGLGTVLERTPDALTYADLRRLELAKAIALGTHALLLDEPFAGLTASELREFSRLIASLRDEGRAIVLVDHNVKGVRALVDRMLVMHAGKKIAEGAPDEVIADAQVRAVYLGGALDVHHVPTARAAEHCAEPLLEVGRMTVHYGKARALHDVSLKVQPGEFVAVVGLNGAGKTTLFNALTGFVPYAGEVRWRGALLRPGGEGAPARDGLVHCPETRELFGDMTIEENLRLGGHLLAEPEVEAQLAWTFGLFPILKERRRQTARTLSGGEQQMLAVGRALMMRPSLLVLDEPTLGLAPVIIEHISAAMEALRKETGLTVLLGEQNVTFAVRHAERIYLLENGELTWSGGAAAFIDEAGERYL